MKRTIKIATIQLLKNVIVTTLTVVVMALSIYSLKVSESVAEVSDNRSDLIMGAEKFVKASVGLTTDVRSYVVTGDEKHYENYWNEVNILKNREEAIESMVNIGITEEEKVTIERMQTLSNNLVPLEEKAMNLRKEGNQEDAIEIVYGIDYFNVVNEISQLQTEFKDMLEVRTGEEVVEINKYNKNVHNMILVALVILLIVQFIIEVKLRTSIVVPIHKCCDALTQLSGGVLKQTVKIDSDTYEINELSETIEKISNVLALIISDLDFSLSEMASRNFNIENDKCVKNYVGDFKSLAKSKEKISDSLSDALCQIDEAAGQVSAGSNLVAIGSQNLAQGSSQQTYSIQELASTISDISKKIDISAEHSKVAKELSINVAKALAEGNKKMQDMIVAMNSMSIKSNEIGKIIKSIDDIAFQTNILSLNAAVEAARAGSAGRGFAVVADEVRNLATKSAQSANDTANLIEETITAMKNGSNIADEAAKSMKKVVSITSDITAYMDNINNASLEQAESIKSINLNVEEILSVVHSNGVTAQESAAASEELSGQAQMLKDLVGEFKLKGHRNIDENVYKNNYKKEVEDIEIKAHYHNDYFVETPEDYHSGEIDYYNDDKY